ncbi:MAG TPA: ABC transporter ATP-binding protein [Tepidisphaeraceae bacterium]|nr:ABC transporter ATP-binding protein [Tepidisphaeraceae bacterium]
MGASSDFAIDLHNVAKIYKGKIHALRGIDMKVHRGEIFGLLGPNGAGKSTLVKIMTTIVRPTHAEGTILNNSIGHKPTLGRVGYLPENHRFPKYLTGRQTIEFFAALSNVDRPTRQRRAHELLDLVGMQQDSNRKLSTYSKGMTQRIGLAQARANDPDLIILDEPTDGVDPVGRRDIRNVLMKLREQGKTIFINSHLLSELEMICDRVAILVAGQVARQGTLNELTVTDQRYEIELHANDEPLRLRQRILQALPNVFSLQAPNPALDAFGKLAAGQVVQLRGAVLSIPTSDPHHIQEVLDALRRSGLIIRRIQHLRPSLEELFMGAVGVSQGPSKGFPIQFGSQPPAA